MMTILKIIKNSNKLIIVTLVFLIFDTEMSKGAFRSLGDKKIAQDIVEIFGKECALRGIADEEVIKTINLELRESDKVKNLDITKCFDQFYSQINAVHSLYQKICDEVSRNTKAISDNVMAKQLLDVNKYQSGIRPYHSLLNDCLTSVSERKGLSFVVPLTGTGLDVREMQKQLDSLIIADPFPSTSVPFR